MDRKTLKTNAKTSLKNCNKNPYIIALVYLIVLSVLSSISAFTGKSENLSAGNSLITFIVELVSFTLTVGFTWWTLSIVRGNDDVGEFKLAFIKIIPVFLVSLINSIIIIIATIIFIIPGIIAELGLSMTTRCLRDNPDSGFFAAIKKSWRIMKGHKWELFVLQLSFIPWAILTVITAGIVGVYTFPYMGTTFSEFYESIKE